MSELSTSVASCAWRSGATARVVSCSSRRSDVGERLSNVTAAPLAHELVEAASRAHVGASREEELHVGVGEDDRPDVAPLEHDAAAVPRLALQVEERVAHRLVAPRPCSRPCPCRGSRMASVTSRAVEATRARPRSRSRCEARGRGARRAHRASAPDGRGVAPTRPAPFALRARPRGTWRPCRRGRSRAHRRGGARRCSCRRRRGRRWRRWGGNVKPRHARTYSIEAPPARGPHPPRRTAARHARRRCAPEAPQGGDELRVARGDDAGVADAARPRAASARTAAVIAMRWSPPAVDVGRSSGPSRPSTSSPSGCSSQVDAEGASTVAIVATRSLSLSAAAPPRRGCASSRGRARRARTRWGSRRLRATTVSPPMAMPRSGARPRVKLRDRLAAPLALRLDRQPGAHVARDLEEARARRVDADAARGDRASPERSARPTTRNAAADTSPGDAQLGKPEACGAQPDVELDHGAHRAQRNAQDLRACARRWSRETEGSLKRVTADA